MSRKRMSSKRVSPQRIRLIEDMTLAGLAEGTREKYVRAVWQLAAYYRRAPDQLSEEEVRAYLLDLRQRGVARGTFQIARYGLQLPNLIVSIQTIDRQASGSRRTSR